MGSALTGWPLFKSIKKKRSIFMNTEKKRKQIIGSMKKCFEKHGMPKLRYEDIIAQPKAGEIIVQSGIRFRYEEDYYNRATVDMIIHEDIPADKLASLRELLNLINMDLACDHFCIIPEINGLVFRTSLYVPGDRLPRNKFIRLLKQFFADYVRNLPIIEKLLVEGGDPEEIFQSLGAERSASLKDKNQHVGADYERLRQDIKKAFVQLGLPVKDDTITENSVSVVSRFRYETCRYELVAFALNDTGQLYLQMFSPDAVPESVISDAIEMADMFNNVSYVNHICILPKHNLVSLLTGVIINPVLDESELEYQLKILFSEGCKYLPVFVGHHPANTSSKEQIKAIIDGVCGRVKF